jgi:enoyl-CoA hydratase/carnithine racemase
VGPLLLHIGYHKTGTTWLQSVWWSDPASGYKWISEHEDWHPVRRIVLERPLEFDAALIRRELDELLEAARGKGLMPVISLERLSGHPFSGGHDSKQIADRLREVLPESRVLIVIREQKSMIASTYKQYVTAGGISPLDRFIDPPTTVGARVPPFDYRHFEYDHLIRYYQTLFGKDAVLVLPYDQLVQDARAFIERIARFAGKPLPEEVLARLPHTPRENPAPSALTISAIRVLNRFTPPRELNAAPLVQSRLALRAAKRLKKRHAPLAQPLDRRKEEQLRRKVASAVGDRYAESNRRTAELTGIDLGALGWPV